MNAYPRNIYARPQFWWRALLVAAGAVGLETGNHRISFYTSQSNIITLGYYLGVLYWMVRRRSTDPAAPRLRGAVTLWILITGLVAHFVTHHGVNPLPGLVHGAPATLLANRSIFLLHYVMPVMAVLDWVAFGPHGAARWRDLPRWLSFPLAYGVISVIRAVLFPSVPDRYPYFFLDPTGHGYGWVALHFLRFAVEFPVLGALIIGLDHLPARLTRARAHVAAAPHVPSATTAWQDAFERLHPGARQHRRVRAARRPDSPDPAEDSATSPDSE